MTFHVVPLMECIFLNLHVQALLECVVKKMTLMLVINNYYLTSKLLKQGYRFHKLGKASPSYIVDILNWFQN